MYKKGESNVKELSLLFVPVASHVRFTSMESRQQFIRITDFKLPTSHGNRL